MLVLGHLLTDMSGKNLLKMCLHTKKLKLKKKKSVAGCPLIHLAQQWAQTHPTTTWTPIIPWTCLGHINVTSSHSQVLREKYLIEWQWAHELLLGFGSSIVPSRWVKVQKGCSFQSSTSHCSAYCASWPQSTSLLVGSPCFFSCSPVQYTHPLDFFCYLSM